MKRLAKLILGLALLISPASGAEYWTHIHSAFLPWPSGLATEAAVLNNELYVLSITANTASSAIRCYRSVNGRDWTGVTLPPLHLILGIRSIQNKLYVFGMLLNGPVANDLCIFKSSDGQNWEIVFQKTPKSFPGAPTIRETITDVCFAGGYVYATATFGSFYRARLDQSPLVWEELPLSNLSSLGGRMFDFQGKLFRWTQLKPSVDSDLIYTIYRLNNDNTWSEAGQYNFGNIVGGQGMTVVKGDELFAGYSKVIATTGDSFSSWTEATTFVLNTQFNYSPFILNDQVYVASRTFPLMKRSASGVWERVSDVSTEFISAHAIGNDSVILGVHDVFVMEKGVRDIELIPVQSNVLVAGQKDNIVLGVETKVNIEDEMKFSVKNLGTAEGGRDIATVNLERRKAGALATAPLEKLAVLTRDGSNNKIWHMTTPVRIEDGDKLFVTVDITSDPRDQTNCIFSIEPSDLDFTINHGFVARSALISNVVQEITPKAAAALDPISEVLIYPNPARDTVKLAYDLTDTSDVTIEIYDRNGILVSDVTDTGKSAGTHAVTTWDSSKIANGVYYAVIKIKPASGSERLFKRKIYIQK